MRTRFSGRPFVALCDTEALLTRRVHHLLRLIVLRVFEGSGHEGQDQRLGVQTIDFIRLLKSCAEVGPSVRSLSVACNRCSYGVCSTYLTLTSSPCVNATRIRPSICSDGVPFWQSSMRA